MIQFAATVGGFYVVFVVVLFVFQRSLIYHPHDETPDPAAYGVPEMQVVFLDTADGLTLRSWYRPNADRRPTIVYFIGNGGHIGHRADKVRPYLDAGYGVLLAGYRGYGGNEGSPSEAGLFADGEAALAFLEAQGVDRASVVVYGESLGTAVAVQLAGRAGGGPRFGAVVLEAPFTSMADAAAYHYPYVPARYLVRDRYDSLSRIGGLSAPLLVVHGEDDRTVPPAQGRRLFAAAPAPKQHAWIAGAGHNDLYDHGAAAVILRFIDEAIAPNGGDPR